MQKISKVSLLAVLGVALSAGPALAALDVTGDNFITGPYSKNKNLVKLERTVEIDVVNKNVEKNYLDYWLNTGKNDVEKNTKVGDVATGNVAAAFDIVNRSNVAGGSTTGGQQGGQQSGNVASDPFLSNSITGPYSENINKVKVNKDFDLDIKNKAYIKNDVDIHANTGKNDVEKNTVVGNVKTGNISVVGSIENVANANQCFTCPDLKDLLNGKDSDVTNLQSVLSNDTTGPDSVNVNKVKIDENVDVNVLNKAYIKNDVDVHANTGKNEVYKNTVVGDVTTGNVTVDFSLVNQAN